MEAFLSTSMTHLHITQCSFNRAVVKTACDFYQSNSQQPPAIRISSLTIFGSKQAGGLRLMNRRPDFLPGYSPR
jgi:hypothetical protein